MGNIPYQNPAFHRNAAKGLSAHSRRSSQSSDLNLAAADAQVQVQGVVPKCQAMHYNLPAFQQKGSVYFYI